MQFSDNNKCAMPADWPNNDLVGSNVIIPPATDVDTANERKAKAKAGEMECYDWWFCHRKI
ncbi:MAG: peroxiredoxin, partial [Candidatus Cloacimonadaceae bacterium]